MAEETPEHIVEGAEAGATEQPAEAGGTRRERNAAARAAKAKQAAGRT